jgi:hypothetical protein
MVGSEIGTRFFRLAGGGVGIEVHDASSANTPEELLTEHGRGLPLVAAPTGGRWGVRQRDGVGKLVWAHITATDDGTGGPGGTGGSVGRRSRFPVLPD